MASAFDSLWERASTIMDEKVDDLVGDRILYALDGTTFLTLAGFVLINANGETGVEELDTMLGVRTRIKIRKTLIGGGPTMVHRFRHPKLGVGTFRPAGDLTVTDGRYSLFDVQEV